MNKKDMITAITKDNKKNKVENPVGLAKMSSKEIVALYNKISKAKTKPEKTETKKEKEFVSMCGMDFDAAKKSTCNSDCKLNNAKSFADCKENFAAMKIKTATKTKAVAERTATGRNVNSQIARIEAAINSGLLTEAEIAVAADTSTKRIRRYFRQAIYREGVMILKNDKGQIFYQKKFPKNKGEQVYVIRNPATSAYIKKYGNAIETKKAA